MANRKDDSGAKVIAMIIALPLAIIVTMLLCFGVFTGEFVTYSVRFAENKTLFLLVSLYHIAIIYLFFSIFKVNYDDIKNTRSKENLFLSSIIYITALMAKLLLAIVIVVAFVMLLAWLKNHVLF